MRMTGRLSAQCPPLVTEDCPAECGQPQACSEENPGQEMIRTAVMSQVRLKYFTEEILNIVFLDEMRNFIVIQSL